jgi:exodeoxyribonuclease V alpha subunit
MSRNDYDRGLFNGDLGLCLRVASHAMAADGSSPAAVDAAVFQRGDSFVWFSLNSLQGDLALAHALTVHRAQGSELDSIALILPDEDLPLLSSELLYTAVTRARRSVAIVGAATILHQGMQRRLQRNSGLGQRLTTI